VVLKYILKPQQLFIIIIINIGEDKYMEHWSIEDYKNFTNNHNRKSKYRANKVSIDGHTFDSQKEADYYCELKIKLQAKEINGFCLQPTFILAPKLKYKADFIVFHKDNSTEIIDVKGVKTKEYIAKKKVFEDKFNLKITEI
jgi:hypothetical protein